MHRGSILTCGRRKSAGIALLSGFAVACVLASPVAAQDSNKDKVADFYKGKTITLYVGSTSGGGYDLYGRLIARHIGNFIPGHPSVIVQNMPGAGSITLTQYLYNVGPKDGTAFGAVFPGAIMEPLLNDAVHVKYQPQKLNYIGSANSEGYVCIVRNDAPLKTFADAFTKQITLGASGGGGSTADFPTMLNNVLGTKFKVVRGYPGSSQISLAIENGEVQGTCGVGWSTVTTGHPNWLRDKIVRVLAEENLEANPNIAKLGAPLTISFAKTDEQRKIMELIYAQPEIGRPFVAGPAVPVDRIAALRKAFAQTVKDKDFLADAAKINLEINNPLTGEALQKLVEKTYATPPDIITKAKQALIAK